MELNGKNTGLLVLCAITAVGAALRIYQATQLPIAGDEIFTIFQAFGLEETGYAFLTSVFYWTVAAADRIYGIATPLEARLPSVLFGALSIPLIYVVGRQIGLSVRGALLGSFILSISQFLIFHSGEIRFYAIGTTLLLALAAVVLHPKFAQHWLFGGIVAGILIYFTVGTHPFFAFPILAYAILAVGSYAERVRGRRVATLDHRGIALLLAVATAGALYLPVLSQVLQTILGEDRQSLLSENAPAPLDFFPFVWDTLSYVSPGYFGIGNEAARYVAIGYRLTWLAGLLFACVMFWKRDLYRYTFVLLGLIGLVLVLAPLVGELHFLAPRYFVFLVVPTALMLGHLLDYAVDAYHKLGWGMTAIALGIPLILLGNNLPYAYNSWFPKPSVSKATVEAAFEALGRQTFFDDRTLYLEVRPSYSGSAWSLAQTLAHMHLLELRQRRFSGVRDSKALWAFVGESDRTLGISYGYGSPQVNYDRCLVLMPPERTSEFLPDDRLDVVFDDQEVVIAWVLIRCSSG